jgi:membrane protein implicated in regulation of membrane protease activity
MSSQVWWLWLILSAIFIIAELFTAGFFLLWFGIGAAVACVFALLGLGLGWQWVIFVVVSGVLFSVSRKFAERVTQKQPPGIGADRFIGKMGIVLEEIDNIKNTGRVRVDKDEWRADSESGNIIPIGEKVVVDKLVGTHLVVKSIKEE